MLGIYIYAIYKIKYNKAISVFIITWHYCLNLYIIVHYLIKNKNPKIMNLNFNLKKDHASVAIITVNIDEETGKMRSFQASDSNVESQLRKDENQNRLRDLVHCIVNGTMCSDRLEIKSPHRSDLYELEQMA